MAELDFTLAIEGRVLKAQWVQYKFGLAVQKFPRCTKRDAKNPDATMDSYWQKVRRELKKLFRKRPPLLRWFTHGPRLECHLYLVIPPERVIWIGPVLAEGLAEEEWKDRKSLAEHDGNREEARRISDAGPYKTFWDPDFKYFLVPVPETTPLSLGVESGLREVLKNLAKSLAQAPLQELPREDTGPAARKMERQVQKAFPEP